MGGRLFESTRGGQSLTPLGEGLVEQAETIECGFSNIETERDGTPQGVVRVSAAEGFATWMIAPVLDQLVKQYDRLSVDLVTNNGFLSPSKRETDIAITLAPPRRGSLMVRKLADYSLGVYAARDYLASHSPVTCPSDLRAHVIVGYVPDFIYAPELRYLEEIDPTLVARLKSTSINAQTGMIAAGAGLAVLPCFIGDSVPALQRILPDIVIRRAFWIVTHQDTRPTPRIEAFVNWLLHVADDGKGRLLGGSP